MSSNPFSFNITWDDIISTSTFKIANTNLKALAPTPAPTPDPTPEPTPAPPFAPPPDTTLAPTPAPTPEPTPTPTPSTPSTPAPDTTPAPTPAQTPSTPAPDTTPAPTPELPSALTPAPPSAPPSAPPHDTTPSTPSTPAPVPMIATVSTPSTPAPVPMIATVSTQQAKHILHEELIILSTKQTDGTYKFNGGINNTNIRKIHDKLDNFKNTVLKNTFDHNIDMKAKKYTTIYITSNIHADIRKLLQLLIKEEIIRINLPTFNPYSNDIYNKPFIEHIEFVNSNTLFIILGDLIDGNNEQNTVYGKHEKYTVDDTQCNFELILHIFLFNMRLKAREKNSEVLFTLGDHDYFNIIYNKGQGTNITGVYYTNQYTQYKHSLKYFVDGKNTTYMYDIFAKFYDLSPYILLMLNNGNDASHTTEFKCIHAGFHTVNTQKKKNN